MTSFNFAASLLLSVLVVGTALGQATNKPTSRSGLDLGSIDKTADPCNDFYQYACGTWMTKNQIPSDESSWGRFNELFERNQTVLRGILEDSEKNLGRSSIDQKIGGFYSSCMNEPVIEQRGTTPLQAELGRIAGIKNQHDLLTEIARLHDLQVDVLFNFSPMPDPKNAAQTIAGLDQGGLGLPEKDFYFRTDKKSVEIRQKYVAHIAKMFELMGTAQADAQKKAAAIMAIETSLAKASMDVTSRRDPVALVHSMSKQELARLSPNFNYDNYFADMKAPGFSTLNVAVPDFVKAMSMLLATQKMADLRDYLTWHYLSASARLLPKAFDDENFNFYRRTLTGVETQRPRWKRCVAATDTELGEALGRKYVEKTFGTEGKQRTLEMVHEIERQMGIEIEAVTWMTPATKKEAMGKLRAVTNKIGYPDQWRDYSSITIAADDYFGNWYRANQFESRRQTAKIGKPVDRKEWEMTPPTVNAYYDPTQNNINFPAGILQPPFYSNQAGDPVNYGAVGAVIGHELTHGFDDQGRQFDANGNLKDWWQKSDAAEFTKLSDCFVNEYGGFSPVTGVELNGKLTLGENSADNGGIRLAYLALLEDLMKKSVPVSSKVDGYTEAQQFFLGYAQDWCEKLRPETARLYAQTDPHSPGKFRVDGVVQNMPEFSRAFGCKAGDKMYAAKGCRVW
jgi:endothelin-converting enzyme/putative endopeptidase